VRGAGTAVYPSTEFIPLTPSILFFASLRKTQDDSGEAGLRMTAVPGEFSIFKAQE